MGPDRSQLPIRFRLGAGGDDGETSDPKGRVMPWRALRVAASGSPYSSV